MFAILSVLLLSVPAGPVLVETRFEQVFPVASNRQFLDPTPGRTRAVVLVHGLGIHPFNGSLAARAELHAWQKPGTPLVKALSKSADVFAFTYGQNTDLDTISRLPALERAINKLHFLGYREIVLVGHSAGGVLVRLFIEDHPDAPVTKVLMVCAPHLGSSWAKADISVRKVQGPFLQSLTKSQRLSVMAQRSGRMIPLHVQCMCVVSGSSALGDGVVSCASQWPEDLQEQGIPVLHVNNTHFTVMHSKKTAALLAEWIDRDFPRLSSTEVRAARRMILGKAD
jgi:pimeloyl-ACP methyl ester carboxylesterase